MENDTSIIDKLTAESTNRAAVLAKLADQSSTEAVYFEDVREGINHSADFAALLLLPTGEALTQKAALYIVQAAIAGEFNSVKIQNGETARLTRNRT